MTADRGLFDRLTGLQFVAWLPDECSHFLQAFHVQLLRLAYPDATNMETGSHRWVCRSK